MYVVSINVCFSGEIKDEFFDPDIENLKNAVNSCPVVLIYGQSCHAKAVFLNALLGQPVLPLYSSRWRWVCIKTFLFFFLFALNLCII